MRRPDGKSRPVCPVQGGGMRTQFLPGAQVLPFGEQPDIHVAQPGTEPVRVFQCVVLLTERHGQPVPGAGGAGEAADEQARSVGVGQLDPHCAVRIGQRGHHGCARQKGSDDPVAGGPILVWPEVAEGVTAAPFLQGLRQVAFRRGRGHGFGRRIGQWRQTHFGILDALHRICGGTATPGRRPLHCCLFQPPWAAPWKCLCW